MKRTVIRWDGKNLPKALKRMPPGRYVLETLRELTPSEEAGIRNRQTRA